MSWLKSILQNTSGEFEVGRSLLVGSSAAAIFSPICFQIWDMLKGAHFDVAAWCAAYPAGLGILNGFGVFAIGRKEVAVAQARQMVAQPPLSDPQTEQK
jgi:hypothetical protein